jgi:hypothetical protein
LKASGQIHRRNGCRGFLSGEVCEKPDLKMAALFVISDQTLGASTIDDSEARLDIIDESVYKLVSFLLPKVLSPN